MSFYKRGLFLTSALDFLLVVSDLDGPSLVVVVVAVVVIVVGSSWIEL